LFLSEIIVEIVLFELLPINAQEITTTDLKERKKKERTYMIFFGQLESLQIETGGGV
jgi:accessory gene regulator protein AgrB